MDTDELTLRACDLKADSKERDAAIQSLAGFDEWESLGRVLVWVTREHNKVLREFHAKDPKAFIQNVDYVQRLPIPESYIVEELLRIKNPGAIVYLRQYREDRFSLPVTNSTGETLSNLEMALERLSEELLRWSPSADVDGRLP